jgi:hypothetical protein
MMISLLVPIRVRHHDSILAVAALVYFSGVHCGAGKPAWARSMLSKECLVGLLFTAGCALPALSHFGQGAPARRWPLLVLFGVYAALAWLNCHAIEVWESGAVSRVRSCAALVAVCSLLFGVCIASGSPRGALLLFVGAVSALLLMLLDSTRSRLTPVTLRAAADIVLLTPILLLPLAERIP